MVGTGARAGWTYVSAPRHLLRNTQVPVADQLTNGTASERAVDVATEATCDLFHLARTDLFVWCCSRAAQVGRCKRSPSPLRKARRW